MAQAAASTAGGDRMSALPTEDGYYWARAANDLDWEIIEVWNGVISRGAGYAHARKADYFHEIRTPRITPPTDTTP